MSKDLHLFLNKQVSNFAVLTEKLHYFHYYVHGPSFFTLHNELREEFNFSFGKVDDLAERLLTIGGKPVSTMRDYLDLTSLVENQKEAKDAQSMIGTVVYDYKQLVSELKTGIEIAEDAEDHVTADLFIGMSEYLQERIWQFNAFLSK